MQETCGERMDDLAMMGAKFMGTGCIAHGISVFLPSHMAELRFVISITP